MASRHGQDNVRFGIGGVSVLRESSCLAQSMYEWSKQLTKYLATSRAATWWPSVAESLRCRLDTSLSRSTHAPHHSSPSPLMPLTTYPPHPLIAHPEFLVPSRSLTPTSRSTKRFQIRQHARRLLRKPLHQHQALRLQHAVVALIGAQQPV